MIMGVEATCDVASVSNNRSKEVVPVGGTAPAPATTASAGVRPGSVFANNPATLVWPEEVGESEPSPPPAAVGGRWSCLSRTRSWAPDGEGRGVVDANDIAYVDGDILVQPLDDALSTVAH